MLDFLKSPPSDRTILIISIIIKIFPGLQVKPLQLILKDKEEITRVWGPWRAPKLLLNIRKIPINPLVGVVTETCPVPSGYTETVRSSQYCSQWGVISKSTPHNNQKDLCHVFLFQSLDCLFPWTGRASEYTQVFLFDTRSWMSNENKLCSSLGKTWCFQAEWNYEPTEKLSSVPTHTLAKPRRAVFECRGKCPQLSIFIKRAVNNVPR